MVVISFVCDVEIYILLGMFPNHFLAFQEVGFVAHSCFTGTLVCASSIPGVNTCNVVLVLTNRGVFKTQSNI